VTHRYDYVDSWETMSGGRMLGHRVAFFPSNVPGSYAGFYGAADTGRMFKITSDGTVFFKASDGYKIAFDGPAREKIIEGDPGGYINFSWSPLKRDVFSEARKRELDAMTVESRGTYVEAERRAREIIAAGDAALLAAAPGVIAPKYVVQSGSELINVYDEKDAAAKAATVDAPKKKKRKPAKKKGIPSWVWIAGGGAVLLVAIVVAVRRKQIGA
jgi:hypothetical protein